MKISRKKPHFIALIILFFFFAFGVVAQTTHEEIQNETNKLQQDLKKIEDEIKQYQNEIAKIQGQKRTLQGQINLLKNEQETLKLQINATGLIVDSLNRQLALLKLEIDENTDQITELKDQMAEILRRIHRNDDTSLIFVILTRNNLSAAIEEIKGYEQLSMSLKGLLQNTEEVGEALSERREMLTEKQEEADRLLGIQKLQELELQKSVNEQAALLTRTRGDERLFNESISESKQEAAEIRSRIYELFQASERVTFGEAVSIAQWASEQTGVRAALLLAILTQESNLGKNVGTCNRAGDPPSKSWKQVMHPTRDQPPFLKITAELGRNPDTTPISCPMRNSDGSQLGWGGAMGPAQFIPSTWIGYRDKVVAITGKPADPWDIRDAFLASAVLLKANGAETNEWAAAMRYFSGGTNPRYSFYGDSVVSLADKYQKDIDSLK